MSKEAIPLLEMKNVGKNFYGNVVLQDINFKLYEGQVLGLVGENGAGKSTLMKILFGMNIIKDTGGYSGSIMMNGKVIYFENPFNALNAGIGMVHQEFSLIPGFTATENILLNREPVKESIISTVFGKRMNTLNRTEMDKIADSSINQLGIQIDKNMLINKMPVGHKQFTEIARELSKDKLKLLILDEPTAVLTEQEAEALLKSIRKMAEKGIAVIFITHRLHEILSVCDKVLVMRDGCIVQNVMAKQTNVSQITSWMVGRNSKNNKTEEKNRKPVNQKKKKEVIMSIKNLWVDMPGETVRNVCLDIIKGEILGIGGLAGQGKIGIPNGIMGLYQSGGIVEFNGKRIALNNPRNCLDNKLAFVSEDRHSVGLLLDESLEWNITFPSMQINNNFLKKYLGGLIHWRDEKKIKEITEKYIEKLQIKCTGTKQPAKELSGGNQQKICLAKAFALEPQFLFVCEPTRGIDVGAKSLVLDSLKKFNRENGITVVMISSELEELRSCCDRIAIVSGGVIAGILPSSAEAEDFGNLMVSNVI